MQKILLTKVGILLLAVLAVLTFVFYFSSQKVYTSGTVQKIDVNSLNQEGNGEPYNKPLIVGENNRYVVFASTSSNLVPNDTNNAMDVFVYDRQNSTIERVSVNDLGEEGNGASGNAFSASADGRYITFDSNATNLVPDDTNGVSDVFVYDRQTNTIERVSVDNLGQEGDGSSNNTTMSSDGRYIAFNSSSANLVPDDTNVVADVFVYDRQTNTIERVSVDNLGQEGDDYSTFPWISGNGRYVSFMSNATNLVPGDTNNTLDIFVYDRQNSTIERVSVDNLGQEGDGESNAPFISNDGRFVAFHSDATNLVPDDTNNARDIFVHDRQTNTTQRVSVNDLGQEGDSTSSSPFLSSDSRYVAFESASSNLVPGDTNDSNDIFVYDRQTNIIERVNINNLGQESNGYSYWTSISSDGQMIAYLSYATNLVEDPTDGVHVYLYQKPIPNNAPTDILLSNNEILEDLPTGSFIGNLSSVDADVGDTHTFTLSCDTPEDDDQYFSIDGNSLESNLVFDYSEKNQYEICIKTEDQNGGEFEKNFIINILMTPPPPPSSSGGGSSGGVVFGCNDENATNHNPFSSHDQSLCQYGESGGGDTPSSEIRNDIQNSFGANCPFFNEYKRIGDKGKEVEMIQYFLKSQNIDPGPIDGIFGNKTDRAVKVFQSLYFNEVLKPWGLSRATGWWYKTTRKKANELSGCYLESPLILDNGVVLQPSI